MDRAVDKTAKYQIEKALFHSKNRHIFGGLTAKIQDDALQNHFKTQEGINIAKQLVNQYIQSNMEKLMTEEKAMDMGHLSIGEDNLVQRLQDKLKNQYSERLRKIFREIKKNGKVKYKPMLNPNYLQAKLGSQRHSREARRGKMLIKEDEYEPNEGETRTINYEPQHLPLLSPQPPFDLHQHSFGSLDLSKMRDHLKTLMDSDTIEHEEFIEGIKVHPESANSAANYLSQLRRIKEELDDEGAEEEEQLGESFDGYLEKMIERLQGDRQEDGGLGQEQSRYRTSSIQNPHKDKMVILSRLKKADSNYAAFMDEIGHYHSIRQRRMERKQNMRSRSLINQAVNKSLEFKSNSPIARAKLQMKQFEASSKNILDLVKEKQKEHFGRGPKQYRLPAIPKQPSKEHSQDLNFEISYEPVKRQSKVQYKEPTRQDILVQSRIKQNDSFEEDQTPKSLGTLLITPRGRDLASASNIQKDQSVESLAQSIGELKISPRYEPKPEVQKFEIQQVVTYGKRPSRTRIDITKKDKNFQQVIEEGIQTSSNSGSIEDINHLIAMKAQSQYASYVTPVQKKVRPVELKLKDEFSLNRLISLKEKLKKGKHQKSFSVNTREKRPGGGSGNFIQNNLEMYRQKIKETMQRRSPQPRFQEAVSIEQPQHHFTFQESSQVSRMNRDLQSSIQGSQAMIENFENFKKKYESLTKRKNRNSHTRQFVEIQSILYTPMETSKKASFAIQRAKDRSPHPLKTQSYSKMMQAIKEKKRRQASGTFDLSQHIIQQFPSQIQCEKDPVIIEHQEQLNSSFQLGLSFLNDQSQINIAQRKSKASKMKKSNQRNPYRNLTNEKKKDAVIQAKFTEQSSQVLSPDASMQNLRMLASNYGNGKVLDQMSGITPFKQLSNAGSEKNIFDMKKDSTLPSMKLMQKSRQVDDDSSFNAQVIGEKFDLIVHVRNQKSEDKKIFKLNQDLNP